MTIHRPTIPKQNLQPKKRKPPPSSSRSNNPNPLLPLLFAVSHHIFPSSPPNHHLHIFLPHIHSITLLTLSICHSPVCRPGWFLRLLVRPSSRFFSYILPLLPSYLVSGSKSTFHLLYHIQPEASPGAAVRSLDRSLLSLGCPRKASYAHQHSPYQEQTYLEATEELTASATCSHNIPQVRHLSPWTLVCCLSQYTRTHTHTHTHHTYIHTYTLFVPCALVSTSRRASSQSGLNFLLLLLLVALVTSSDLLCDG